jgi:hypothetical protein
VARWTGVAWRYVRFALLAVVLWLAYQVVTKAASCARDPWKTYPMDSPPDITCRVGSVAGWNVWIWTCVDGERVAIGKHSAEMYSGAPEKDTAACGTVTALEQRIGIPDREDCRSGRSWRWDNGPEQPPIVRRYKLGFGAEGSSAGSDGEQRRMVVSAAFEVVHRVVRKLGVYAYVDLYGNDDLVLEMAHATTPAEVAAVDRELAKAAVLERIDTP